MELGDNTDIQDNSIQEVAFLRDFMKSLFKRDSLMEDCVQSMNLSILNNYCLVAHGFNGDDGSNGHSIVAAMFYDCSQDGIWFDWLGVANGIFSILYFGPKGTGRLSKQWASDVSSWVWLNYTIQV